MWKDVPLDNPHVGAVEAVVEPRAGVAEAVEGVVVAVAEGAEAVGVGDVVVVEDVVVVVEAKEYLVVALEDSGWREIH